VVVQSPLQVLLVGPECTRNKGRQLMLEVDGYEVVRARDLTEALGRLRARRPDLVVVDGGEARATESLAARIGRESGTGGVPVLAVDPCGPSGGDRTFLGLADHLRVVR
jgi:CheY-like chemotaxis protein